MKHSTIPATALSVLCLGAIPGMAAPGKASLRARGEVPEMPYDPNTVAGCTWWHDNDGFMSCDELLGFMGIPLDRFIAWNPSVTDTCGNFQTGFSYCVEGPSVPITTTPGSSTTTPITTPTTASPSTTTTPGNGIATPTPIQPGMVGNCDAFHFVTEGQGCNDVLTRNGITLAQLFAWNPAVRNDCSGMWANVYVCVSTTNHTPSPTTPGNGIANPTPTQPGMVSNCDGFYRVASGDTCDTIAAKNGISVTQFRQWNTNVGGTACNGLWLNAYVCVSTIGHTPTTTRGNGVATPTPTQSGMVNNCNRFHFVATGQNCDSIARQYGITVANFVRWNPAAGSNCAGLWSNTYACVGVM